MTRGRLLLAALALLGACATAPPALPPAPAPASAVVPAGYRAKTPQGVELVFDVRHEAFAVVGRPDHWWVDQRFYRRERGAWLVAQSLAGPWTACSDRDLPRGLRAEGGG